MPFGSTPPTPPLVARGISKSFGGTRALDDVSIAVMPGELHALLGPNGSGKSTLVKVLAGYHAPAPGGELHICGRPVRLPVEPADVRAGGVRFVHQELGLVASLSVTENLMLEELATTRRIHYSRRDEKRHAREMMARFELDVDPNARAGALRPADQAKVAIVRALGGMPAGSAARQRAGVLVLDEPTSYMPPRDRRQLFAQLHELVATGASVMLVSHHLQEMHEIADRVTVLRDGRNVATLPAKECTPGGLAAMLVGRAPASAHPLPRRMKHGEIGASIVALSGDLVREVSLDLRKGEVVGLTGPTGSGFDDVPYIVFGARPCQQGRLFLHRDYDLRGMTPARAVRAGIALLPADRQNDGGVGALSIADNLALPDLDRYRHRFRLDRRRMFRDVSKLLAEYDVRPNRPTLGYQALSGGNEQKALLAKWLAVKPALVLLAEPTQGLDTAAHAQVSTLIRRTAAQGSSVLCASSDYEHLASTCDRVFVLAQGRVAQELSGSAVTRGRIAHVCDRLADATT